MDLKEIERIEPGDVKRSGAERRKLRCSIQRGVKEVSVDTSKVDRTGTLQGNNHQKILKKANDGQF